MSEPLSSSSTEAHRFDHDGRRNLLLNGKLDGTNFEEAKGFMTGSMVGSFSTAFDFFGDLSSLSSRLAS